MLFRKAEQHRHQGAQHANRDHAGNHNVCARHISANLQHIAQTGTRRKHFCRDQRRSTRRPSAVRMPVNTIGIADGTPTFNKGLKGCRQPKVLATLMSVLFVRLDARIGVDNSGNKYGQEYDRRLGLQVKYRSKTTTTGIHAIGGTGRKSSKPGEQICQPA